LRERFLIIFLLAAPALACVPEVNGQEATAETRTPEGALWRAAAVPGWGQAYNRQYYKIPIVWAGLGGFGAAAVYLHGEYHLFNRAFQYQAWEEVAARTGQPNPVSHYQGDHARVVSRYGETQTPLLRNHRNKLRRNRDLMIGGIGLWYGLTILDAYVAAQLLDFDVGEDLTVAIRPSLTGLTATLSLNL
jgi:hypothetical protein